MCIREKLPLTFQGNCEWSSQRRFLAIGVNSFLVFCFCFLLLPASAIGQEDSGLPRLEREILRLAEFSGGRVGVAAVHLETGREVYLNADEWFPMASTYKVPIAVQLLRRVDNNEVKLDQMVEVTPVDLHPGSGTLSQLLDDPGVELSLLNLLELMLLISDNSATDLSLEIAGGGQSVTALMRDSGIEGITVDRPTVELIADWLGVEGLPSNGKITREKFSDLRNLVSESEREHAETVFEQDKRDSATPRGMAQLLSGIWQEEIISQKHSELLLDIMRRCQTGDGRIKGLLPLETEVFHKTGTIGRVTNDVGIVTLPEDMGHVITVVFVKQSVFPVPERERAIAHISRAIHDYFLFNPK